MDLKISDDTIFNGRLKLTQPAQGYRFALDSLLLADFAQAEPGRTVADFGAGCGVIALALAKKMTRGRVLAVEIQPELAKLARSNCQANAQTKMVQVLELDWTRLTPGLAGGLLDHIVCNPPYRGLGSGRLNPNPEVAAARHEIKGSLLTAAETAVKILVPKGLFSAVYPASRLIHLLTVLRKQKLEPKKLRMVHSRPGEPAVLALVEARLNGGEELEVRPPLYIYEKEKDYTDEVEAIVSGKVFA